MMSRLFALVVAVVVVFGAGCKSTETTSAVIHNQTGRYDLAIQRANEALAKNPNDAEAEFQLGLSYSYLDSVGLAYAHFQKAARLDPKREKLVRDNVQSNFAKHYNQALNSLKEDDQQGAAREFEMSVEANPLEPKGHFQLGSTFTRLGDKSQDSTEAVGYYSKAVVNFDKVLELAKPTDKEYVDGLKYAGKVLAKTGKTEEALARFNRLIEEDPSNYKDVEEIGYDFINEKSWQNATVFLELAARARAKIGDDDFTLLFNLGVAYFNIGKDKSDPAALSKSVEYYQKALTLTPDDAQTIKNVVVAYALSQNWRSAAEWGERYVTVKPDDADGWRLLTRSYNEIGETEKARRCEQRYNELRERGSGTP